MSNRTYPIDEFIRNLFDGGDHIAFKTATLQLNLIGKRHFIILDI